MMHRRSLRSLRRDLPENVVILPTAAQRQVQQRWNKETRAAKRALQEAHPWPGEHLFPGQREAIRRAKVIRSVERSAALRIAVAALGALDDASRAKAMSWLAVESLSGTTEAKQALEIARCAAMTVGEHYDLDFALKWLAERPD